MFAKNWKPHRVLPPSMRQGRSPLVMYNFHTKENTPTDLFCLLILKSDNTSEDKSRTMRSLHSQNNRAVCLFKKTRKNRHYLLSSKLRSKTAYHLVVCGWCFSMFTARCPRYRKWSRRYERSRTLKQSIIWLRLRSCSPATSSIRWTRASGSISDIDFMVESYSFCYSL